MKPGLVVYTWRPDGIEETWGSVDAKETTISSKLEEGWRNQPNKKADCGGFDERWVGHQTLHFLPIFMSWFQLPKIMNTQIQQPNRLPTIYKWKEIKKI